MSEREKPSGIGKKAALISFFTGVGALSGFAVDATMAAFWGMGQKTDAFFAAYTLPRMLQTLLMLSARSVLIPCFSSYRFQGNEGRFEVFFSIILNLILCLSLFICILGSLGAPWIIAIIVPGLSMEGKELAFQLTRLLFFYVFFSGGVEVLRALFFAQDSVVLPAGINVIQSAVVIATVLLTVKTWGIVGVALGYVFGTAAQFVLLFVVAHRTFLRSYHFRFQVSYPGVRGTIRNFFVLMSGTLIGQIGVVMERLLASYLPQGSISALSYARKLYNVIADVFLSSVTVASLPTLAENVSQALEHKVQQVVYAMFKVMTLLTVPLATLGVILAAPAIAVLYERGTFHHQDTVHTASVFIGFLVGLPFMGYLRCVQNYFYGLKQPGKVVVLFTGMTCLYVCLATVAVKFFGAVGLSLSFSFATLIIAGIGMGWVSRDLGGFPWGRLGGLSAKVGGASLMMGSVTYCLKQWLVTRIPVHDWLTQSAILLIAGLGGVAMFAVVAQLLRIEGWQMVLDRVRSR